MYRRIAAAGPELDVQRGHVQLLLLLYIRQITIPAEERCHHYQHEVHLREGD